MQPFFAAVRPVENAQHGDTTAAAVPPSPHRAELSMEDLINTIAGAHAL